MRYFLFRTLYIVVITIIFISLLGSLLPYNKDGYLIEFSKKKDALKNSSRESSVILIGGSSVAFGFDSKILSDSLKMNVLNNGLHAGVGLKLMLDQISSYAKSGDVIVLEPEYDLFWGKAMYGEDPLADVFFANPDISSSFDMNQWKTIINNTPQHIKANIDYCVYSLAGRPNSSIYRLSSFNSFGDLVGHWGEKGVPYEQSLPNGKNLNGNAVQYCVKKIEEMKEKGATVLLMPPPISRTSFDNINSNIEKISDAFAAQGVYYCCPPDVFAYNDSLFYDTRYHLGHQGAEEHSKAIASLIKKQLSITKCDK